MAAMKHNKIILLIMLIGLIYAISVIGPPFLEMFPFILGTPSCSKLPTVEEVQAALDEHRDVSK